MKTEENNLYSEEENPLDEQAGLDSTTDASRRFSFWVLIGMGAILLVLAGVISMR